MDASLWPWHGFYCLVAGAGGSGQEDFFSVLNLHPPRLVPTAALSQAWAPSLPSPLHVISHYLSPVVLTTGPYVSLSVALDNSRGSGGIRPHF